MNGIFMKNKNKNLAVSEILGAVLLLGIAVTCFSVISYMILSTPTPVKSPNVEISGTFFENQVVLTHRWGESLTLDTGVYLSYYEHNVSFVAGDCLDAESRSNGFWDIGEKLYYPVPDDFDYVTYPEIDVKLVDDRGKNLEFIGIIDYDPTCDLAIQVSVNNSYPKENEKVTFTITLINEWTINSTGTTVKFQLPPGLTYVSSTADQGSYSSDDNIWEVGTIAPGQSTNLQIVAVCGKINYSSTPTQLVLILDGTSSIDSPSWDLLRQGISSVLGEGGYFPHDGTSELTVIQFGGDESDSSNKYYFAQLEINPTKISESNVNVIRNRIENLIQLGGAPTATSCGVYLAADTIKKSATYDPSLRQIFLLITDGNPTHCCDCCEYDYINDQCSGNNGPKNAVLEAVNWSAEYLDLNLDQDEFDAIVVDLQGQGHVYDLLESATWPRPGYMVPPFIPEPHRGWVRIADSWDDFAISINEAFGYLFNKVSVKAIIIDNIITDPIITNNEATNYVTIIPDYPEKDK
jgi:uncharacterized repeat protein (TIGR01451 family)